MRLRNGGNELESPILEDMYGFWMDTDLSEIVDEYSDDSVIEKYIEDERYEFREEWFEYVESEE